MTVAFFFVSSQLQTLKLGAFLALPASFKFGRSKCQLSVPAASRGAGGFPIIMISESMARARFPGPAVTLPHDGLENRNSIAGE